MVIENEKELSLGEFLQEARIKNSISLEKVAEELKIVYHHLQALETDNYSKLPPPVYLKAILKKYAAFLDLPFEEVMVKYQKINNRTLVSGKNDQLPQNKFFIVATRRLFSHHFLKVFLQIFILSLIILLIGGYFFYKLSVLFLPPKIILKNYPQDINVSISPIVLQGRVLRAELLFINNHRVFLDENGEFKETLGLEPGINTIQLKAVNRLGKEKIITQRIIYSIINK